MKRRNPASATKKIVGSFALLILIGSVLLSLPLTNKVTPQPYINNLFVATSCVCVTGLTPFTVVDQYNVAGQLIMLILIQLGGLGFITFLYLFLYIAGSKISLTTKMVFTEALNQNNFKILPRLLKTVYYYTGGFELLGAILLSIAFVPKYGFVKGIYYGIWHSVSAFCNAGFDLLGSNSLMNYATSPLVNFTVMILIVAGGLGFIVALDLYDKYKKQKHFNYKKYFRSLSLHSKVVLLSTFILIVSGAVIIFALEFSNPETIGHYNILDKALISLFQSITLRTAGFATISIAGLRDVTKLIICGYMFIGGSPASTAGGIKTVTIALVILTVINVFKGNSETVVFNRRIKKRIFLKAFTLFAVGLFLCMFNIILMMMTNPNIPMVDIIVEVFSAFGTVGLSANVTGVLNFAGKVINIILMFIGRISPMSLMIFFSRMAHLNSSTTYVDEDVIVG